ncbi:MAG: hypothetical protein DRH11_00310 [Deltaproteobacteria bacterium]|nr:MAG: hypothetical protein DRH11_00310 [Deltaproteobacteria bacterium]
MSLSNTLTNSPHDGNSWAKLEMDSFESSSPAVLEKRGEFTPLRAGGDENPGFIPFEQTEADETTRKQAKDLLQQAREQAAILEKEAYEKGFAQGEKDGLELGQKKAAKIVEDLENLLEQVSRSKKEMLRLHEKQILELVFAIAKKIIKKQLASIDDAVKQTILSALHLAAEKSKVVLRISPEDFSYVERLRPELFSKFQELKSVVVTSDPSITKGGCFVETSYGDVDARVETQLAKVHESLEKAFLEKSNDHY